jgi:hypothetical protein
MNSVADRLKDHLSTVSPGLPFTITDAHQVGEGGWQGDLGIEIAPAGVPKGYVKVENPTDADRQLAVEAGAGSHHRLRSLDGVELYRPKDWGKADDDVRGPYIVLTKPNAIVHEPGHDHPHGTVNIAGPCNLQIRYQRNLDAETRKEIRARD